MPGHIKVTKRSNGQAVTRVEIRPQFRRLYGLDERPRPYDLPSHRWWRKGVQPARDSYRQKAYKAERSLEEWVETGGGRTFTDFKQLARYLRSVMETAWFQRRFPDFVKLDIKLYESTRCRGGPLLYIPGSRERVERGRVRFARWGFNELIALHELAHAVLPDTHRHDRRWARVYADLVGFKMGRDAGGRLRAAFREHNIITNPVRQMSREQKEKLTALGQAALGRRSGAENANG